MIELLVLGGVLAATGVAYLLRRLGKSGAASDLELVRDATRLLTRGLLEKGEDRAVDYVMSKLGPDKVRTLARALGAERYDNEWAARAVRVWLANQLKQLLRKGEGKK